MSTSERIAAAARRSAPVDTLHQHDAMGPALLSASDLAAANEALRWARSYLMAEHPLLRRPGASQVVCPFVRASVVHDCLYVAIHSDVAGGRGAQERIEQIMMAAMHDFTALGSARPSDRPKLALLVLFPSVQESETAVLDSAHATLKDAYVAAGLMIGQFHGSCDERSVHNPELRVSRAPVPLMAVRYMSRHDILFLHERRSWFEEYASRFGGHYADAHDLSEYESHIAGVFRRTVERFRG